MNNKEIISDFEATLQLAEMIGLQTSPDHLPTTSSHGPNSRRKICLADWRVFMNKAKHTEVKEKHLKSNATYFDENPLFSSRKSNTYGNLCFGSQKKQFRETPRERDVKTARTTYRRQVNSEEQSSRMNMTFEKMKRAAIEVKNKRNILKDLVNTTSKEKEKGSIMKRKNRPSIKIRFNKKTNRFQFF